MASIVNFVEKEGKFFAPILNNTAPNYVVRDGAVVQDGTKVTRGAKGVYAQVRIELPVSISMNRRELFALNTEAVNSSN